MKSLFFRNIKHDNQHANRNAEQGFSILEALIAIAILAAAMLPLLALQGRFVQTVESFERANTRLAAQQSVLAMLETKNYTLTPTGDIELGDVSVKWVATQVENPRRTRDTGAHEARFEVTLFDVNVELFMQDGRRETLALRGLGWRPMWPHE